MEIAKERRYALAYRNNSTQGEWVLISRFTGGYARDHAHDAFEAIKADYATSDLAVFFYREGDYWQDGAIRRAAYHWTEKPVVLGGLIEKFDQHICG